jgi:hypothetical protein
MRNTDGAEAIDALVVHVIVADDPSLPMTVGALMKATPCAGGVGR